MWLNSQRKSVNISQMEDITSQIEAGLKSSENPFHPENPEGSIIKVLFTFSLYSRILFCILTCPFLISTIRLRFLIVSLLVKLECKEDLSLSEWAKNVWYWSYRNETHRNYWSSCTYHVITLHSTSAFVSWPLRPLFGLKFIST